MARLLSPILESLGDALRPTSQPTIESASPLVPGSAAAREVEKSAALVGAILAAGTASGFDAAALFYALRDVLAEAPVRPDERAALRRFAEWITVVAFD